MPHLNRSAPSVGGSGAGLKRAWLFSRLQMLMVQNVVADINRQTGESECQYYKERLLYSEEGQRDELIERSRTLSCHGELKNNRGLVSGA